MQQGITTANELAAHTEAELKAFPHLGAASITAIKKALHAFDFRLGDVKARKILAQRELDAEEVAEDPDRDPRLRQPAEHHTEIREIELAAKHWMWLDNCAKLTRTTVEHYLRKIVAASWAKDVHGGRTYGQPESRTMKREDFKEYKRHLQSGESDGL